MVSKKLRLSVRSGSVRLTLEGCYSHDWGAGVTVYWVSGSRISGAFTLEHEPHRYADEFTADPHGYRRTFSAVDVDSNRVRVRFGTGPEQHYGLGEDRQDRPVVNGVTLAGSTFVNVDEMRKAPLHASDINCRRIEDGWRFDEPAPPGAHERTSLVVQALVRHWLGRPENYALRLAACRVAARPGGSAGSRVRDKLKEAGEALERAQEDFSKAFCHMQDVHAYASAPPPRPVGEEGPPSELSASPREGTNLAITG